MNRAWLNLLLSSASLLFATDAAPYASRTPLPEPIVFAPGVVSTGDYESHPAFTPDGKTIYFLKDTPTFSFWTIVESHFMNGRWSTPEVAAFSGQYSDADPFITSDGSKCFFISNRPLKAGERAKEDMDIWVMEKTPKGWGEPRNLGEPINSSGSEWYPTMASDGTLYFGSDRPGGKGKTDLYRAPIKDGIYQPENLGAPINTEFQEYEPFIAPDQSFVIFMSIRPKGRGQSDLYISYNQNGSWTEPKNLGEKINSPGTEYSPKISPDGKYFFFSSSKATVGEQPFERRQSYRELIEKLRSPGNGLGDIYQVDLSATGIANAK